MSKDKEQQRKLCSGHYLWNLQTELDSMRTANTERYFNSTIVMIPIYYV